MDIIQRLILVVFLSLPAFLPNTALANFTAPITYVTFGMSFDSIAAACSYGNQQHAASFNRAITKETYCQLNSNNTNYYTRPVVSRYFYIQQLPYGEVDADAPVNAVQLCPAPSTFVSGSFPNVICSGNLPPPPPTCEKDKEQSYKTPTASGGDSCVGGCVVRMDEGRCGSNAAGVQMCFYDGHQTGDTCTTSNATAGSDTGNDPAYDCAKQGKTWGTVNGQTVCLKAGTGGSPPIKSVSAGKTTTNTAADGTQTTTQDPPKVTTVTPPASGAADGSPPKITEETVNPDGTASKTEESADKFCESHPDNAQCKNLEKSEYSGNCNPDGTVTINCKGDAIQCNIAQKQAEMNCKIFQPDEAMTNAYNEAKNDNGSANLSLPQNASIINLPSELDASSPYAAQCNSDITFSFNGDTITLPLSAWCGVLEAVGYLFLALSYVTAAIILGGAI